MGETYKENVIRVFPKVKVPNGQDPYDVIGQYIQNHIKVIEDIIATIEIDGVRTNELFMVDWEEDGGFVWKSDWYEGEQNIALIDFFPVSDAKPERKKKGKWIINGDYIDCSVCRHDKWSRVPFEGLVKIFNYCPNCGADMRGEGDERNI